MTVHLQEAAQLLKAHFGERLETGKEEGRDLMAETLQEKLGLSADDAKEMVDALEQANTIRWQTQAQAGSPTPAVTPFAETTGVESTIGPTTSAAIPLVDGYWQL